MLEVQVLPAPVLLSMLEAEAEEQVKLVIMHQIIMLARVEMEEHQLLVEVR